MQLPQNPFKAAIRSGKPQIGLWASLNDPTSIEMLSLCGFDWIMIDTEHSTIERPDIPNLLRAFGQSPTQPLVRPVALDAGEIKKLLDMGAQNLLIPFIQSVEEAELAVRAVTYAPEGIRGYAGMTRANRFGLVADYAKRAREEICALIQIETVKGLEALDDILVVQGLDGVFVGPADLAASMGYPGQPTHPQVRKVCADIIRRIRKAGLPAGFLSFDEEFLDEMVAAGSVFTAIAVDTAILRRGAMEAASRWRGKLKSQAQLA